MIQAEILWEPAEESKGDGPMSGARSPWNGLLEEERKAQQENSERAIARALVNAAVQGKLTPLKIQDGQIEVENEKWKPGIEQDSKRLTGLYLSLDELMRADLPRRDEILVGVRRGEVAELVSSTNVGKTTLLLNTALGLGAGIDFPPLVSKEKHKPVKVLIVDFESPADWLRRDLAVMKKRLPSGLTTHNHLLMLVDAEFGGEPFALEKTAHMQKLQSVVQENAVGLVIIDTVSSGFNLRNENDNAEVKERVMGPLTHLARFCNCAVIFSHHHGKPSETGGERAYYGRGASAFGALARAVFTLKRDEAKGDNYVILEFAKIKGVKPEPVLLVLEKETRWFKVCSEKPTTTDEVSVERIVSRFSGKKASKSEILSGFPDASLRTIERRLAEAIQLGLATRSGREYQFRQSATPYIGGELAEIKEPDEIPVREGEL